MTRGTEAQEKEGEGCLKARPTSTAQNVIFNYKKLFFHITRTFIDF
jgi:hypothetical protein